MDSDPFPDAHLPYKTKTWEKAMNPYIKHLYPKQVPEWAASIPSVWIFIGISAGVL